MIEHKVWLARDGWRVEIRHGANWLQYGAYSAEQDARLVAAELIRKLTRERPQQGELFPESA